MRNRAIRTVKSRFGFTIVELLVVIVIIGILVSIVVTSYAGLSSNAITASLQSDLTNAAQQLKLAQTEHNTYPATTDCNQPDSSTNKCIKVSSGATLTYQYDNSNNPQTFVLYAKKGGVIYRVTSESAPVQTALICPIGFVIVPGSVTYGTSDFCMMKYEAKRVGSSTTPISRANGTPWVFNTQTAAISNSVNVAGCTGCQLINEAQWMTVAQNVMSVPSNWSGGSVGSGYIYGGHNDGAPANVISADVNDKNGYYGTGNTTGNQRRTLTLTNGEAIWDLSGNVHEWTSGTTSGDHQPGIDGSGYAYREWTSITNPGSLTIDPSPVGTGLTGANNWNGANGMGQVRSSSDDNGGPYAFLRSGDFTDGSANAGVLALLLGLAPSYGGSDIVTGFRVAAPGQ